MSKMKASKVFLVRAEDGTPLGHVIARHGKGALSIAKSHGLRTSGADTEEAADDRAAFAINAALEA